MRSAVRFKTAHPGAGEMTDRITLQRAVETPDDGGGRAVTWSTIATAWARVTLLFGDEGNRDGAMRESQGYLFSIYRRADLTTADRLQWQGRSMNIIEIRLPPPHHLAMEIVARTEDPV